MSENYSEDVVSRRQFVVGAVAAGLIGSTRAKSSSVASDDIAVWHNETEQVSPDVYRQYMTDGGTRGFASLEKLEAAFEKVMREVKNTKVNGIPAVWSVYNMGYVIKTRESLFSIDLVHRRDLEFASMLDFALVTHNHSDH